MLFEPLSLQWAPLLLFLALLGVFVVLPSYVKRMIWCLGSLIKLLVKVRLHAITKAGKYYSAVDEFERQVDAYPTRVQVIVADEENGREVKLIEMESLANKVAHWSQDVLSLRPGDTVALMMYNNPDFISFWLGIAKVCVATALINTNATGVTLLHSVKLATQSCTRDKVLVVDEELYNNSIVKDTAVVRGLEELGVKVYVWQELIQAGGHVSTCSSIRPSKDFRMSHCKESDAVLFIFTSGTTGLPKTCKISHSRWFLGTLPLGQFCSLRAGDRVYCPLPLYHSAAGMMGVGAAISFGAALVIRKKFSVSTFSKDCINYKIKVVQYIGELCRYLTNAPPNPLDELVRLDSAYGNGLSPDVWTKFQQRYNVKHIVEFYAATEGNLALFNATDKVGALGFVPRICDFLYPIMIVKHEPDQPGVPMRDFKGNCVVANPNEIGLLIGEINTRRVDRRFDGYTDAAATQSKVLHNVFARGDTYFNTGDLLTRDRWGFFFWSDRIGDTFRWKGENVSTAEISSVLSEVPGVRECCVYGVSVPNCDGKCGMASVVIEEEGKKVQDVEACVASIHDTLKAHLPPFARPLFLQILDEIPKTSTFKQQKGDLVKAGFDPKSASSSAGDRRIYFYHPKAGSYQVMTGSAFQDISSGAIRY